MLGKYLWMRRTMCVSHYDKLGEIKKFCTVESQLAKSILWDSMKIPPIQRHVLAVGLLQCWSCVWGWPQCQPGLKHIPDTSRLMWLDFLRMLGLAMFHSCLVSVQSSALRAMLEPKSASNGRQGQLSLALAPCEGAQNMPLWHKIILSWQRLRMGFVFLNSLICLKAEPL